MHIAYIIHIPYMHYTYYEYTIILQYRFQHGTF